MSETGLKIRLYGDRALRKKAKAVKQINEEIRALLSEMSRLMYAGSGIGLAAPQVGVGLALIVADIGNSLYKLVNPKVVKKASSQSLEEGCLSIPGVCLKVKRAKKILVQAEDEFARPVSIEAEGLLACVLQHEIDHLRGRLIVDYASLLDKIKIKRKLEGLRRKVRDERLPEQGSKSCQLQL